MADCGVFRWLFVLSSPLLNFRLVARKKVWILPGWKETMARGKIGNRETLVGTQDASYFTCSVTHFCPISWNIKWVLADENRRKRKRIGERGYRRAISWTLWVLFFHLHYCSIFLSVSFIWKKRWLLIGEQRREGICERLREWDNGIAIKRRTCAFFSPLVIFQHPRSHLRRVWLLMSE